MAGKRGQRKWTKIDNVKHLQSVCNLTDIKEELRIVAQSASLCGFENLARRLDKIRNWLDVTTDALRETDPPTPKPISPEGYQTTLI